VGEDAMAMVKLTGVTADNIWKRYWNDLEGLRKRENTATLWKRNCTSHDGRDKMAP
jgi:hypothetical protein